MNEILQLIAAVVIIVALYIFMTMVFLKKKIIYKGGSYNVYPSKNTIDLVTGQMPLGASSVVLNTYDATATNYVYIPQPSNSTDGGFAYSFWMNRGNNSSANLKNNIIFMRGIIQYSAVVHNGETKNMILVKSPLLRFGDSETELAIDFNTLNEPHNTWVINSDVIKIMSGNKWGMYTIVFKDNKDEYGVKNGLRIDLFIDNKLISSYKKLGDSIRMNSGNIHILPNTVGMGSGDLWHPPAPTISPKSGYVADVKYYNYAPSVNDIDKIFSKGFKTGSFVTPQNIRSKKMDNDYKLINLYNETKQIVNKQL
jgi:hypothetical protein